MGKERINTKLVYMVELAVLLAIEIVMAFTPIGYIKTAGLEITLMPIPVVVGAIVLGPAAGAFLGLVFGITSFIQCFGMSAFGAALLQISLWRTLVTTVPTRFLMGWLTGLIFKLFKKKNFWSFSLTSLCGALLNTIFFMGTLMPLFWHTTYIQGFAKMYHATNVWAFMAAFIGINGLVECLTNFFISGAISGAVYKAVNKNGTRAVIPKKKKSKIELESSNHE